MRVGALIERIYLDLFRDARFAMWIMQLNTAVLALWAEY